MGLMRVEMQPLYLTNIPLTGVLVVTRPLGNISILLLKPILCTELYKTVKSVVGKCYKISDTLKTKMLRLTLSIKLVFNRKPQNTHLHNSS